MSDDASKLPESSGATIGQYEIVDVLHRGVSATVYLAIAPESDREVAIKVVIEGGRDGPRDRPAPNAPIAPRLVHRHIVRILDQGEDGGLSYVVMERLRGRSLRDRITNSTTPVDLATAIDLVAQLCMGLHHAHTYTVVHGNITPDNVFLTDDGVVKILNFGAVSYGGGTVVADNGLSGSSEYMSPEQLLGREIVDGRSDVYSAGALLHELVSGRPPVQGSGTALAPRIVRQDGPPLEGTAKLDVLIRRALEEDPSKRFASAQELAYALWMVHLPDIDTTEDEAPEPGLTVYSERLGDVDAPANGDAPLVEKFALSRQTLIYGAIAAVLIVGVAGSVVSCWVQ